MKIWHRVGFASKPGLEHKLESHGIDLKRTPLPGGHYFVTFDIDELDPAWSVVEPNIRYESVSDVVETLFRPQEILSAEWVRMRPTFEQGYPEPQQTWASNPVNLVQKCPKCGAGYTQVAPYRIFKEPNMGRNDFLSLHWTYSIFCTRRVLSQLQERELRGYKVWEAIIHRTGLSSEVVSQLTAQDFTSGGLVSQEQIMPIVCTSCGLTKLAYHRKGYMHYMRNAIRDDRDILYTAEWFGNGSVAFREILVSKRFAKLILDQGWKGVALKPLALV